MRVRSLRTTSEAHPSAAGTLPAKSGAGWTMSTFEHIIVESKGAVGIITLNRPKMLNALSFGVFREIAAAVDDLEADDGIGCILLTGSEKAFAAGADIKEMQPKTFIDMFSSDFTAIGGDRVASCRKPTIAAVSGYALGGGCELAMMCDIIIAADTAKFGQPEITLGTIPGIGGTQRLKKPRRDGVDGPLRHQLCQNEVVEISDKGAVREPDYPHWNGYVEAYFSAAWG